ncbi:unnamed protein product [Cochlearia groenlandica]
MVDESSGKHSLTFSEKEISSVLVEEWKDPEVCWTFQFPPKNKFLPTVHLSFGDDDDEEAEEDEEVDGDVLLLVEKPK